MILLSWFLSYLRLKVVEIDQKGERVIVSFTRNYLQSIKLFLKWFTKMGVGLCL